MSKRPVRTIEDIARLAGVSKSTVSRVLSNSPLISDRTKQRVLAIAKEHNFRIHQPARRLSLRHSSTIGFVTHGHTKNISVEDLFQLEMLGAISAALSSYNYDLLMLHVDPYDNNWPNEYLNTGRVDGFILMTSTRKQHHIQTLLEIQAPFIIWGVPVPPHSYCSVVGDSFRGGHLAGEHLVQSGRKKIAFIGGPEDELEVTLRLQGFQTALDQAGIPADPGLITFGDFTSAFGSQAIRELLERSPEVDAVFANSDIMAIGVINTLHSLGKNVPDDIAVVGYDDLSIAQHATPPLTTIRQHLPQAGQLLVQNLIQHIQTGVVTNVSIPVELVTRGSA
jgi:DNA-binding LacI/PurR family transcriptional regulator